MTSKPAKFGTLALSVLSAIAVTPLFLGSTPGQAQSPTPRPTTTTSPQPTTSPTPRPTASPTPRPTTSPTPRPTASPTPRPSPSATPRPTTSPTPRPSPTPGTGNILKKYSANTAPVLRAGSRGQVVRDIQTVLKQAKLYTGTVDGVYGPQTQAAVIRFQQARKLAADGVIGPRTWTAMINL
jgi:outer membrane biosynthesis protein TonB